MAIKSIALDRLLVNRANDRHGELENETAAIAWLFSAREIHMRSLARDIVQQGAIYEYPLVSPVDEKFIVFDGNRRVTCLKLLADPRRAPTAELQTFFAEERSRWKGSFPLKILCQVEADRERVDEILFRRHTGSQGGVGQSTWDDRMKATFVARTGKASGLSVADEVEKRLREASLLPARRKIPRSTMNRLLSAEPFRNRLGFSISRGRFEYTHDEGVSLGAMARVAEDLVNRKVVLGHLWDVDGKRSYLDGLEQEGVLPTARHSLATSKPQTNASSEKPKRGSPVPRASKRLNLIPAADYGLTWPGRLQRHHQIWDELQFRLELNRHPNAISVLFRVLLELAVENYIQQAGVTVFEKDKLATKLLKVGNDMRGKAKIDSKQVGMLQKFQHSDQLISADTLNRYVHSPNFAPSPEHLMSMWDSLSEIIVLCLEA